MAEPQISARAATRPTTNQISSPTAPRAVRTSSTMCWMSNGGRSSAPTPSATARSATVPQYGLTNSPSRHSVVLAATVRACRIKLRSENDFRRLLLQIDQRMKQAAEPEQLLVRAALADSAPVENDDAVYTLESGQAVRDDERRAVPRQTTDRFLNQLFAQRVHRRGRLVQNQNPGITEDGARNRDSLALTDGEMRAPLADVGIVRIGPAQNEDVRVRKPRGCHDVVKARVGPAIADVVTDRPAEQHRFLEHDPDLTPQVLEPDPPDIDAVQLDA